MLEEMSYYEYCVHQTESTSWTVLRCRRGQRTGGGDVMYGEGLAGPSSSDRRRMESPPACSLLKAALAKEHIAHTVTPPPLCNIMHPNPHA
jgi:hypothetical protein